MKTRQDGVSTIKGLQYDNTPRWRVHKKGSNMITRQDGASTIKGLLIVLNLTSSTKYPHSPSRATQSNEMACRTNGNQHTRYQPNTASIRYIWMYYFK